MYGRVGVRYLRMVPRHVRANRARVRHNRMRAVNVEDTSMNPDEPATLHFDTDDEMQGYFRRFGYTHTEGNSWLSADKLATVIRQFDGGYNVEIVDR